MHRTLPGVLLALLLIGCQGKSVVDDNAVLGPPPPRQKLALDESESGDLDRAEPLIQRASHTAAPAFDINRLDEIVVARVSGQPVFAADVLRPYRPLIEAKRQMLARIPMDQRSLAAAQLEAETRELLTRSMDDYLDREVILQTLNRTLKKEQLEAVAEQIDSVFDERVNELMDATGITSRAELESILVKLDDPKFPDVIQAWRKTFGTNPSTTLQESHDAFSKMAMAAEFLRLKAKEPADVNRTQLLEYYREHAEDYDVPLEIKWQQIVIVNRDHGGSDGAERKMRQVVDLLKGGADFDAVAKEHSAGPTASDGGVRDWIAKNSLADSEIEDALFEMPVGQISRVFERDDRFEIVRTTERRGGKRRSFAAVQDEIRKTLLIESQQQARRDTLKEMRDGADVVVLYNGEETLDVE